MKIVGQNFTLVTYSITGKRNMDKLGTLSKPAEAHMQWLEEERIGKASSKGPAYYDVLRVLFPLHGATKAIAAMNAAATQVIPKVSIRTDKVKIEGLRPKVIQYL